MGKSSGTEARIKRGIALAQSGAVSQHGDAYVVAGESRNYTIWLKDDGDPSCDCPDFRKRRQTCKHGYSVLVFVARCRRQKTAKPKTDRRHKAADDSLAGITADVDVRSLAGAFGVPGAFRTPLTDAASPPCRWRWGSYGDLSTNS